MDKNRVIFLLLPWTFFRWKKRGMVVRGCGGDLSNSLTPNLDVMSALMYLSCLALKANRLHLGVPLCTRAKQRSSAFARTPVIVAFSCRWGCIPFKLFPLGIKTTCEKNQRSSTVSTLRCTQNFAGYKNDPHSNMLSCPVSSSCFSRNWYVPIWPRVDDSIRKSRPVFYASKKMSFSQDNSVMS